MDMQREYETIMQEITGGLVGEPLHDVEFISRKCREYRNHPLGSEILQACWFMAFRYMPEKLKEEIEAVIAQSNFVFTLELKEIRGLIARGHVQTAYLKIKEMIAENPAAEFIRDSEIAEYRCFDEEFEEVLYTRLYNSPGEIKPIGKPYPEMYRLYAYLLAERGRTAEARLALKKGLRYNPVSFALNAAYIETFKMSGDLERFFELTVDAFRLAFRPADVAHCYRNIGFYFVRKELYREAAAALYLSLRYERNTDVQSQLFTVASKIGGYAEETDPEQITAYAVQYGFPTGPDADILKQALSSAQFFRVRNDPDSELYFLKIAHSLTGDEETKTLIEDAERRAGEEGDGRD